MALESLVRHHTTPLPAFRNLHGNVINQALQVVFLVLEEETSTYDISEVLSDTGGALGLFLGLSVLSILRSLGDIYKKLPRKIRKNRLKNTESGAGHENTHVATPRKRSYRKDS